MGAHQSKSNTTSTTERAEGSSSGGEHQHMLTNYQKQLLRHAWQRMNKTSRSGSIGNMIFRRLLAKSPDIKQLFQHVVVIEGVFKFGMMPIQARQHHSSLFTDILEQAMEKLDRLDQLATVCCEWGAKHAAYNSYGMHVDYWDRLGEAIAESSREWEGWKKHRETLKAWTILVSFICDRLRQGHEEETRRMTFRPNTNVTQVTDAAVHAEQQQGPSQTQNTRNRGPELKRGRSLQAPHTPFNT